MSKTSDEEAFAIGCGCLILTISAVAFAGAIAVFGSFVAKVAWNIIRWTWT